MPWRRAWLGVGLFGCGAITPVAAPCAGTGRGLVPPAVALEVGERVALEFPGGPWDCVAEGYRPGEAVAWTVTDTSTAAITTGGEVVGKRPGTTTARGTVRRDLRLSASALVTVRE